MSKPAINGNNTSRDHCVSCGKPVWVQQRLPGWLSFWANAMSDWTFVGIHTGVGDVCSTTCKRRALRPISHDKRPRYLLSR